MEITPNNLEEATMQDYYEEELLQRDNEIEELKEEIEALNSIISNK